jgi:deazaflavin-dependent oxidoreductase (nitroreductase family)
MKKRTPVMVMSGLAAVIGGRALVRRGAADRLAEMEDEPADTGMMLAMHAAFRRDLDRLIAACRRPSHGTDAARGWQLLRRELEVHHGAEDDDLWPKLRGRLADSGDDQAVVTEMYAEHRRIGPLLDAVEATLGTESAERAVRELAQAVREHLDHEERAMLPLLRSHLSNREWHEFLLLERDKRRPPDRVTWLTWVLDDAEPRHAEAVLRELPAPGRFVCRHLLRRIYERRRLWGRTKAIHPYHPSRAQALGNKVLTRMVRRGRGPEFISLLTVPGRITGEPHTTPVVPVEHDDERWLVAPFGEVGWVRNARASGHVDLARGDDVRTYEIDEVDPQEAVPVLRDYLSMPSARYVRDYFDVTADSPDEAIAAEAPRHPVFALHG